MKNQKGITLIALVITIIVLLILAGITIAMLTGDNGLLTKSQQAATDNAIAGAKDIVAMNVQKGITDYLQDYYSNDSATAREKLDVVSKVATAVGTANVNGCAIANTVTADSTSGALSGYITITKDGRKCAGRVTGNKGTGTSVGSYVVTWESMRAQTSDNDPID